MTGIADLEIYNIARNLSKDVRKIYEKLTIDIKRNIPYNIFGGFVNQRK